MGHEIALEIAIVIAIEILFFGYQLND